jgi:hypothetical protein
MKISEHHLAKHIPQALIIFVAYSLGVVTAPSPAFAYIDPGTGTMLIQVIVAAIFGALFTLKAWLGALKSVFIKDKPSEESPAVTKEEEQK